MDEPRPDRPHPRAPGADPQATEASSAEGRPAQGQQGLSLAPEPIAEAEVRAQFDDMDVDQPRVGIVMGSKSDMEAMEKAARELEERGILHEVRVMSAHREPDVVAEYSKAARMRGLRVIIAGAGSRRRCRVPSPPIPTCRSSACRCRAG